MRKIKTEKKIPGDLFSPLKLQQLEEGQNRGGWGRSTRKHSDLAGGGFQISTEQVLSPWPGWGVSQSPHYWSPEVGIKDAPKVDPGDSWLLWSSAQQTWTGNGSQGSPEKDSKS